MADFKTHVTFSSAIGCGYAVVAKGMGFDLSTSLVAGGLCGVSGMLPDVDSDSGVPRREALGFAAAVVPLLLVDRAAQFELRHDQMILAGALLYFGIRYLAADLIGRWSVHRGMWHSVPAVLIFAGLAFLGAGGEIFARYLKAGAVGLGAFSHLVLDEVYSVDTRGVVPRLKKSFGTAVKFWGKDRWANLSTYTKLALVAFAITMDMSFIDRIKQRNPELAEQFRRNRDRVASLQDRFPTNESQPPEQAAPRVGEPSQPAWSSRPSPANARLSAPHRPAPPVQRPPVYAPPSSGFLPNRGSQPYR